MSDVHTAILRLISKQGESEPADVVRKLSVRYRSVDISWGLLRLVDKDNPEHKLKMLKNGKLTLIY